MEDTVAVSVTNWANNVNTQTTEQIGFVVQ